jgi:DNA repair exonuclease SbcCD ATPase subunit
MENRTDVYGEFAIWVWGKKIPTEIAECQKFMRESPLGDYIRELDGKLLPKPELIKIIDSYVEMRSCLNTIKDLPDNIACSSIKNLVKDALLNKLPVSKGENDELKEANAHREMELFCANRKLKEQAEELATLKDTSEQYKQYRKAIDKIREQAEELRKHKEATLDGDCQVCDYETFQRKIKEQAEELAKMREALEKIRANIHPIADNIQRGIVEPAEGMHRLSEIATIALENKAGSW